ncbi:MAG: glycogen debranching enzyme-like protein [Parcubacteria group bacterium Greene0416_14]|nr:MAG: glycogen debranching enzyme-like protein [Parcubacteria group bacterium Greene0416_14]TSD00907.1 MAG: glycogen debranching enzyme-like protein [Parcubacteria group bacterium Greene1014_15]TSD07989.1 MAG: glycogen debranching enzyme-like protein [Parcubacteria group bacterium Greene0714_4]
MTQTKLVNTAHVKAREVLNTCLTSSGFRASALTKGYPQIWSRDNGIMALGISALGDSKLIEGIRGSLITMRVYQSKRGLIQLNVMPDSGEVSTENAGAVDSNLWYLISHALYFLDKQDTNFLLESWDSINRALQWIEFQDMNEDGLIEIPEAGNWMDLFGVRYNTLYDNVLYYLALRAYEYMARNIEKTKHHAFATKPTAIAERINALFWVDRCWHGGHFSEHLEKLKSMRLEWFMLYHNMGAISSRPFYLPWVGFREYGDFFDSFGNMLSILTGITNEHRTESIERYMHQVHISNPYPTKAIYPTIRPGDPMWREYYRSRNLNMPDHYHNGGIWPMLGGFEIAMLVHCKRFKEAQAKLVLLAEANERGIYNPWEFNEWLHGATGEPMGYPMQGWSASSFLFAEYCVATKRVPFFEDILR